jgi:hypothetical protein
MPASPSRSGGLRASEIMAAMKGEDWTMTPDAVAPTVVPKPEPEQKDLDAANEKSGPLPGDWAISLDPQAPGGWSAPSKVEKLPEVKQSPSSGNRNIAVSSDKAIEAVEWEEKPTGIGEALVQIDPSLMGHADDVPIVEDEEPVNIVSTPVVDVPPPSKPIPPPLGPMPFISSTPTPPPWAGPPLPPPPLPPMPPPLPPPPIAAASAAFPVLPVRPDITDNNTNFFRETGEVASFTHDPTDAFENKRKRRTLLIVIGAGLAVAVTVTIIMLTGGKKTAPKPTAGSGSGSAMVVAVPVDAAVAIAPPPAVDAGVAAPQTCAVDVTTNPTGAEIAIDKTVLGTSPATIQLPCGVESKLTIRKAKYGSVQKSFTATAEANKLSVKIAAPVFSLKVTSVPAGATITIAGKTVGITPTTIKVAAFSQTMITVTKAGFQPDTEKIAPRQSNVTHHVVLKPATKKLR